ncbi:TonB-dependent receptor [Reyranella sp.]|uniref:TonB-dependent receptor n=1 Tax=Reyranella sp. TaxID=1929291 RepID=UPI0025DD2588|nr:TonB-dependent receptor [Reyranella sp.]
MPANVETARLPGVLSVAYGSALAFGTASAICVSLCAPAWAQTPAEELQAQAPAPRTASFDIPAQPLAAALTSFGRQAGLQIVFDAGSVAGKSTAGVSGTMTVEQALQRLLSGTGATFRYSSPTSVTITTMGSSAMMLDPVQVQGVFPVPSQAMIDNIPPAYAGGQVATGGQLGLLGNRDVMDTPFNQTSYTAKKAQDQQAQTIRDVLIDDPSVRAVRPSGNNGAQNMMIRGFTVECTDIAYGGLYGLLPTYAIGVELAERIEVLKGPSAMLNGMPPTGAIGGTINVVPKRAHDEPMNRVTAAYSSAAQFGGAVDIGRRFGPEKEVGVRINGAYRAGQTAVMWNAEELGLATIGVDYRGDGFRLSLDGGYQSQYISGGIGYATVAPGAPGAPVPGVPDLNNNFILPWSFTSAQDLFGALRGEVDVWPGVTLYGAIGAHDNRWSSLWSGDPIVSGLSGNSTQTPLYNTSYETKWTSEIGLRGEATTGPVGHTFAVSAMRYQQVFGFGRGIGTAYASNIYTPNVVARPNITTMSPNKSSTLQLTSLAIADTLSLAEKRVQLTLGARYQQIVGENFNIVTGNRTSGYTQDAISPSVALVVRPWKEVSFYGNFIQGLQPGTVVGPTFANAGQIFAPYQSTQFEVGTKIDWGKFTTTLSAFQISQPSAIANAATNMLTQNGLQRNRGIEINMFGAPTEGVRLLGGAMFQEAILVSTAGGVNDGWQAAGAPNVQVNLAAEWDTPFARGLTLDGRVIYTGTQYVGLTDPRLSIPEWVRFDVGARYVLSDAQSPTGKPVAIRFNVENLLDTNYWSMVSFNTRLNVGTPRTFRLALTADF